MPDASANGDPCPATARLGFGCAHLHHIARVDRAADLVRAAVEAGLTHLDTSPYYGFGVSETIVGTAVAGHRSRVTIATKIGLYPPGDRFVPHMGVIAMKALGRLRPSLTAPLVDPSPDRAERSLTRSLRTLRTDYVDFLFVHEPDLSTAQSDALLAWLDRARSRGLIRSWGIAGTPERCAPLIAAGHGLSAVVQTSLGTGGGVPPSIADAGVMPRFLYGVAAAARAIGGGSFGATVAGLLRRHTASTLLVSTRARDHLSALARALEEGAS